MLETGRYTDRVFTKWCLLQTSMKGIISQNKDKARTNSFSKNHCLLDIHHFDLTQNDVLLLKLLSKLYQTLRVLCFIKTQ